MAKMDQTFNTSGVEGGQGLAGQWGTSTLIEFMLLGKFSLPSSPSGDIRLVDLPRTVQDPLENRQ
jgi:hypothetical protein